MRTEVLLDNSPMRLICNHDLVRTTTIWSSQAGSALAQLTQAGVDRWSISSVPAGPLFANATTYIRCNRESVTASIVEAGIPIMGSFLISRTDSLKLPASRFNPYVYVTGSFKDTARDATRMLPIVRTSIFNAAFRISACFRIRSDRFPASRNEFHFYFEEPSPLPPGEAAPEITSNDPVSVRFFGCDSDWRRGYAAKLVELALADVMSTKAEDPKGWLAERQRLAQQYLQFPSTPPGM